MNAGAATPGSQSSLREANRARVLSAVKRFGSLTQVEVAGATGLSPATVSNIVRELVGAGILKRSPTSRSGRRAQQVSLARTLGVAAGIHVGHRHLRIVLADLSHTVLAETRLPLAADHRADVELDRAALLISDQLESIGATHDELLTVGLGLPAPIDTRTGQVSAPGVLPGWAGVPIADRLSARLGRPVHVDNDANLGALAEFRYGAARGCDHAAYISVSHGVGAGLVVDGRLFRGRAGTAGEIGHVTIDEDGPVCRCGNRGCLETFVRAPVLLEMLRASHGPLTLKDVIVRARSGDAGCRRVVADAGRHIGVAAASLCNLLNPERLVIGGELAGAGPILLDPIRDVVERLAIPTAAGTVTIVQGELADRAEMMGALALALSEAEVAVGVRSLAIPS